MNITFNGLSNPSNMLCFSSVPNVIRITDTDSGTKGSITLTFKSGLTATGDSQYTITILDNTIVNVLNPAEAVGQNFYISSDRNSTAFSVARALRACPNVTANFYIQHGTNTVMLIAKQTGSIFGQYSISVQTNISSTYLTVSSTDGTSTSSLNNANVEVALSVNNNSTPIAVLEKNAHNGEVAFDISSVIGSVSDYGALTSFRYKISLLNDNGNYTLLQTSNINAFTQGYKTKDSYDYLYLQSTPQIALAVDRGTSRNLFNNTLLYVYDNKIPLTVYTTSGSVGYSITYYDSAFNVLGTGSGSTSVSNRMADFTINLNNTYFTPNCFYVDITIGSNTIRYNVIKPLRMTEENTRLYWRNEYGGVQFFDFSGSKSETKEREENIYHNGNAIYDYYDTNIKEYEGVYSLNIDEKINVTSHLIEKDGIWQFDSLVRAKKVWTYIDGTMYGVVIDNVSVEETEQNNIYRASVQYHTAELQ